MTTRESKARRNTAGEALNGFGVWRRLHWDHFNREDVSDIHSARHFKQFPRRPNVENLQMRMDDWLLLKNEFAQGTPDRSLLPSFYDILLKDYMQSPFVLLRHNGLEPRAAIKNAYSEPSITSDNGTPNLTHLHLHKRMLTYDYANQTNEIKYDKHNTVQHI